MSNKVSWGTVTKAKSNTGGGGIDFKELFLRPQAPKGTGEKNTYVVRFLENPHPYLVHWNRKTINDKPAKVDFFDGSDEYRKINRNCFGSMDADGEQVGYDKCPWCKAGYHKQLRYMVNVIDYTDRKNPRIRILDAPRSVMEEVANWVEAVYETEGDYIDPSAWDADVPQFVISVEKTSSSGGVKYSVSASSKSRPMTESELELVRDLNPDATTDDDALKLHEIDRWIQATKPRTDAHGNALPEEGSKDSTYEDVEDEPEDGDEGLKKKTSKPAAAASQKPAAAKKPAKPADDDDDEDDSADKDADDEDDEESGEKEDWF